MNSGGNKSYTIPCFQNKSTFEMLEFWIEEYKREQPNSEIVIVGNKEDETPHAITDDVASAFAETKHSVALTCSAKTGRGINEVFETLGRRILNNQSVLSSIVEETDDQDVLKQKKKEKCC